MTESQRPQELTTQHSEFVDRIEYHGGPRPVHVQYGVSSDGVRQVAHYREWATNDTPNPSEAGPRAYGGHADEFKYLARLLDIETAGNTRPLYELGYGYTQRTAPDGIELDFNLPTPGDLPKGFHNAFQINASVYSGRLTNGDFTRALIHDGFPPGKGDSIMSAHEYIVHMPFLLSAEPSIAERVIERGRSTTANDGQEAYEKFEQDFEHAARAETVVAALEAGRFSDEEIFSQLTSFDGCDPAVFKVHDRISYLLYGEAMEDPTAISDTIKYIRHLEAFFGMHLPAYA